MRRLVLISAALVLTLSTAPADTPAPKAAHAGDAPVATVKLDGTISALAFAPDGKTLALGVGNDVILWDTAAKTKRATWAGHEAQIEALTYSPDGKTLASSGGQDHTVILWDVA